MSDSKTFKDNKKSEKYLHRGHKGDSGFETVEEEHAVDRASSVICHR